MLRLTDSQYIPCLYVLNKIDQITIEELDILYRIPNCVPISGYHMWNIDTLLETIWARLNFVRIYTKPRGQLPDFTDPVILPAGKTTMVEFCNRIHRTIINEFK